MVAPIAPSNDSEDLSGRLAVVTGGAGDLGVAIARELLGHGARVILADRDQEGAEKAAADLDGDVRAIHVDLEDDDSIRVFADEIEKLGGCSILISNAGRAVVEPFLESDPATWDSLYRVNQRGPILLTQLLLPTLLATGSGRLVFVASDGARAGASGEAIYASTKAALFGFAKCVARESARHGTTVNVVCPGPVKGRMVEELLADKQSQLSHFERSIPMRRLAEPDDIASLVGWLSSRSAGYFTGQILSVSGGLTMH